MPPKRKATSALTSAKPVKKGNLIKKENISAVTKEDNTDRTQSGKIISNKRNEETGFCSFTKKILSPELLDKDQNTKEVEFPNLALNHLLQQKSKINLQGSLRWKTYLFPFLSKLTLGTEFTHQYFGLDLVDEDKERTHWTHKASVWQNIFSSIIDLAKTGQVPPISPAFDGILSCPVRAEPNGPNEIETFRSGKGQNIQHWIMLVPMPSEYDYSEYIPLFLSKFQALFKKLYIQSAYKSGVVGITLHSGLISQISEEGNYWHVLDSATQKEVMSQSFHSLSEVLMDFTIKDVISNMFGVDTDPHTWTDAIKFYAFGN